MKILRRFAKVLSTRFCTSMRRAADCIDCERPTLDRLRIIRMGNLFNLEPV